MADSNSGPFIKPETFPKILAIAGIAIVVKIYLLQWLIDFATESLHLAMLVGGLAFIIFLFTSTRVGIFFNVLCKYVASMFVAVFPLQIMEEIIDRAIKKQQLINQDLAKVLGVKTKTEDKIDEFKQKAEHAFNQAQYAKSQGDMTQAGASAGEANQYLQAVKDLQPSLDQSTRTYTRLNKLYENSGYIVKSMQTQLSINKDKFALLAAGSNIVKQMSAIYDSNSADNQIYGQSFEALKTDMANKAGQIDRFYDATSEISKSIDLDKGANMMDGLNILDQFEKSGNIEMLLNPHTDNTISLPSNNNLAALPSNSGSVGASKYDSYVK